MPGRVLLVEAVVQVLVVEALSSSAAAVVASVELSGGSRRLWEPQPVQVDQRVSAEVLFQPSLSTFILYNRSKVPHATPTLSSRPDMLVNIVVLEINA